MNEHGLLSDHDADDDVDVGEGARRPIDVTALVAGLVVLAFCAATTFGDLDSLEDQLRIVWPLALGAIGVGLLADIRRR